MNMRPDLSNSISPEQAAKECGFSAWIIRKEIREKRLPAFRIGGGYRIARSDFDAFINASRTVKQ